MSDPQTAAICNKVLRAALAAKVAQREGLDLASDEGEAAMSYLSLIQFDLLGYPMGDSLLPLIQIARPADQEADGSDEDGAEEIGMTWFDQQVEDTRADLHDRLLNASPTLGQEISLLPQANPVLNRVYEDALKEAKFAGGIEGGSAEAEQAREFLFPTNDDGVPGKSEALRLYESFEEDIRELDLAIANAQSRADDEEMRRLQNRRERKAAEWLAIGQKRRVEDAIRIMNNADRDAGFEDERLRFIEELELRKIGRTVSAKDFARVDLRPLEPLINPDEKNHWRTIEISGAELPELCPIKIRHLFGLKLDEIELASETVVGFSVDIATVMLIREWLSDEFLTARYWRLDGTTLSDGKGAGTMPTQATRAIFLRNASYRIDGDLSAKQSQESAKTGAVKLVPQFTKIETPLLTQLTTVQKAAGSSVGAAKLSALAQTKLTRGQIGRMRHLVQLKNPVVTAGRTAKIAIGAKPHRRAATVRTAKPAGGLNAALVAKLGAAGMLNSAALLKPEVRVRDRRRRDARKKRPRTQARPARRRVARVATRRRRPADRQERLVAINRSGIVTTSPMVTQGDFTITFQRRISGNAVGPEEPVGVTADGAERYRFALIVQPRFAGDPKFPILTDIVLRLRGEKGDVLDEMTIAFGSRANGKPIAWTITRDVSLLEMTAPTHPVLFAYALQVLPRSPNPDENLDWSETI